MRLILILFARMQVRLAEHELQRCAMLDRYADEALDRGQARMRFAHSLAARANIERT